MKPEVHQFKLNVPVDLMAQLKAIATSENRSVSAQMLRMLRQKMQQEQAASRNEVENEIPAALEGVAGAAAGVDLGGRAPAAE